MKHRGPEIKIDTSKWVTGVIPPKKYHGNGKSPVPTGDTSSNSSFSIVILDFGGVTITLLNGDEVHLKHPW